MISQYNLQRVTLDFEESLREGIHQAFNGLTFIGCKFHLNQAIQRKAKKKGLLSSNLEKETRDIIDKINKILEGDTKSFEGYLQNLKEEYILKAQNSSLNKGKNLLIFFKRFF